VRNAKTVIVVLALCAAGAGGGVAVAAAKPRPARPRARLWATISPTTAQGIGRGPRANGAVVVATPAHDSADGRGPQGRAGNKPPAPAKTTMIVASAPTTAFLPSDYWY
jgi:hypothetical protein